LESIDKAMMDQMHWNDYFCKLKFTLLVYQTGPSYLYTALSRITVGLLLMCVELATEDHLNL
jgi:hypothetical protein